MRNLEIYDLCRRRLNIGCNNFTNIAISTENIYVLKDSKLTVYDINGAEIATSALNFICRTDFKVIPNLFRLMFGTGNNFVAVNTRNNKVIEIFDAVVPFTAAEWNLSNDYIVALEQTGRIGFYTFHLNGDVLTLSYVANYYSEFESSALTIHGLCKLFSDENSSLEEIGEKPISVNDDSSCISWCPDGEYFAVNYRWNDKRKICIYTRMGDKILETEDIAGLCSQISWRPVYNTLACCVRTNEHYGIKLYNKNGMPENFLELVSPTALLSMKWNKSGEIFAAHHLMPDDKSSIFIYKIRNCRWHLKQQLNFTTILCTIEFINSPLLIDSLRVITNNEILTYSFKLITHAVKHSHDKNALVNAIINCNSVYITYCKEGWLPNPMYDYEIKLENPINFIIFHPSDTKLAVIDTDNKLSIFRFTASNAEQLEQYELHYDTATNTPLCFHHFYWESPTVIKCLGDVDYNGKPVTKKFKLVMADDAIANWIFELDSEDDDIHKNHVGPLQNFSVTTKDGLACAVHTNDDRIIPYTLTEPALYIAQYSIQQHTILFSLTPESVLYMNNIQLGSGIQSFMLHNDYAFFTTTENQLVGIHVTESFLSWFQNNKAIDRLLERAYVEPIEPGAIVLFGLPGTSKIVLQIPRGNLEIYSCSMILLNSIEHLIKEQSWCDAIQLIQINKLNLNILVDLNMDRFLQNVKKFVDVISVKSLLNDFIQELVNTNVLTSYSKNFVPHLTRVNNKVELVCNAMIEYLKVKNYIQYLDTIVLCCLTQRNVRSIQNALQHIRCTLHSTVYLDQNVMKRVENALRVIRKIKDDSEIYTECLLTYDLDLIMFAACNLNMDPQEYEPFIEKLREMDESRRRFEINDFVKKPQAAIKYLILCSNDEAEIMDYITKYKIYKVAYLHVNPSYKIFKKISDHYGLYLSSLGHHEEAGLIYSRAGLHASALEAYKAAGACDECINMMNILCVSTSERADHLSALAKNLISKGRIIEACKIYEVQLDDQDVAVQILLEHKHFSEALALAKRHSREDLCIVDISEEVDKYTQVLLEKLKSMEATFNEYNSRLIAIRNTKREMAEEKCLHPLRLPEDYSNVIETHDDGASIISGTTTNSSRMTSTSSRNRRREQLKREDLKVGGVYEDIALIKALYNLIVETFQLGHGVHELCVIKMHINITISANVLQLHEILRLLQGDMLKSLPEIWPKGMNNFEESSERFAAEVHDNVRFLDVKYRSPPENLYKDWILYSLTNQES